MYLYWPEIGLPNITKTCLYNFDPLQPRFYIVKLVFTGGYTLFFLFLLKNINLWELVRTASAQVSYKNNRKSNKRTKSTKISSLFPKRGNCNAKRTEEHKYKIAQCKT